MKKIRLLMVTFGLLLTIISSGQTTLTFRLTNPSIDFAAGTNYLNFDIEVKSSSLGSYLFSGQANLNFNTSVLSSNPVDWFAVSKGSLLAGNYPNPVQLTGVKYPSFTPSVTGSVFNLAWGANAALVNQSPSSTYFNQVLDTWQPVATVTVKIINSDLGVAGISFVTSSMDAQEFYQASAGVRGNYTVAYSNDMSNLFVGRVYSAAFGWTQVGGGTAWTTALNTSVYDGTAILPIPSITGSPANASAIRIHSGATLGIPSTGQLTATSIENNTANGLAIQSDATGTGSLIVGSVTGLTGTAVAQRYMTTGAWHQVSPPLVGQPIANFLTANDNVASSGSNRAMINYVTSTNAWSPFYTNSSGGTFAAGQGYMMRSGTNTVVNFGGVVTTGSPGLNLSGAGDTGWNLIGNPFTSAISLNDLADATNGFMHINAGSLDASNVGVYFWNQGTGVYDVINNATGSAQYATLGQAFFVKSIANNAAISFPAAMQVHQNGVVLKSGNAYPEIKLIAANDGKNASTSIKFIDGTTKGLDPGYDAGIFKLDASVSLYTKLVEDNGVQFMLQCLPNSDISKIIIPVGIDSKTGGQVVFSAELINMPSDAKVILEDKLLKTFTDLSKNDYTVTIAANSSITERFQIHTSYLTTGTTTDLAFEKLSAYAYRNIEIRLKGTVSAGAVATLYDVQGRTILVKILEGSNLNIIPTPNIRTGIYMLSVNDHGKVTGFKIPVAE